MSTRLLPRLFGALWAVAVSLFVLVPFALMFLVSISGGESLDFPWEGGGVSLEPYWAFFANSRMQSAFLNSVRLAVVTGVGTLAIASLVSLALARYRFRGRALIRALNISPLPVPGVMIALALLIFTSSVLGWRSGFWRIFVSHLIITLPFAVATMTAALTGFDRNQEFAAYNLGAGPWRAFFSVVLPQVRSGFSAAAVLAFVVSFDNVAVSVFLVGPNYSTLPVEIYAYAVETLSPMVVAGAMVMVGFSVIAVAIIERTFGIQEILGRK